MQARELKEYQRLRSAGLWPKASEFRNVERLRLRKEGRNKQAARDESWRLMLLKYPDASAVVTSEPKRKEPAYATIDLEHVPNFDELLRWTLCYIGTDPDDLDPSLIPTRAHAAVLQFANRDKRTFWKWIAESDAKRNAKAADRKPFVDDGRTHFELMDAILADPRWRKKPQFSAPDAVGTP